VELLLDLFGYLTIILHGVAIAAQATLIGSVCFLALVAHPAGIDPGPAERIGIWAGAALIGATLAAIAMQVAVLSDTVEIGVWAALTAQPTLARLAKLVFVLVLLVSLRRRAIWLRVTLILLLITAASLTTHAVARLDDRVVPFLATWLHQLGAALWIGGIPAFLAALRADSGRTRIVAERFSAVSVAGVACLLAGAALLTWFYIGHPSALYGTAYGVMVSAKVALLLVLLGFGAGNFLLVRGLRRDPHRSLSRLRRFAEAELGIGLAVFFAASSLTSVPPAIDLRDQRVTWAEIVERNTPHWPRLSSPDHDTLALPALQSRLDAEAAERRAKPQASFTPGAGEMPPRNAADVAWSEYNHHWAGLFVVTVALLALANQAGLRAARHWPLVFLGLAVFLLIRSDPEVWPMGHIGFFESLRDVEVLQHRLYVALIIVFAWFEWRVRVRPDRAGWRALVFPLLCATGGVLLLTHTHAIANIREQLLIEITHTPLALAGVMAGWARWLELRLDHAAHPLAARIAGWAWPLCILIVGVTLLSYREA
jgi:putative copper resistance protein D